jgi:hypothetical protein
LSHFRAAGFRARSGEPFAQAAEGTSHEEALSKLEALIKGQLSAGAQLVALQVPASNPWVTFTGMFKDNPLFDEVIEIMAENRRLDEEDPDYL